MLIRMRTALDMLMIPGSHPEAATGNNLNRRGRA